MTHRLAELPYPYDALEPHIDALTLQIHHGKHHQAYVNNLNAALEGHPELAAKDVHALIADLAAVPEAIRTAVRNHGGGHANHDIYWSIMGPGGGGAPTGALARAIDAAFGSFDNLRDLVNKAGLTQFGSGWAWITVTPDKKLLVESTLNQESPASAGRAPILTVDVWEHAYYLKYQNRRGDHLAAWWNTVNWPAVAERFERAMG